CEIIVVDDASSDESRALIEKLQGTLGVSLTLLETNHRNAAAARNTGIQAARGDWVAFLDADDIWLPEHLENAARILEGSDDVAFMANHNFLQGDKTVGIPEGMQHRIESAGQLDADLWVELVERGFHFGHSTVLYRTDRLREVGGFDEKQKRRHDLDLWLRLVADHTWAYNAKPAALYRTDTPGSISKDVVDCEYFYLKALLKNRPRYQNQAMHSLISTSAQRLMSLSFVDGRPEEFRQAHRLAWPYIRPKFRMFYSMAGICRPLFRALVRAKRRWVWRNHA
ncbi:glycosyltransferase family 2 protein, partial [bacterium]